MKVLIFDTETTGLPERKGYDTCFHPSELDKYKNCRLIQLAYAIMDEDNVTFKNFIISPNDFKIENSHIHGITQEFAEREGKPIENILQIFYQDLKESSLLIAHNLAFDFNTIVSECYRKDFKKLIQTLNDIDKFCTMEEGKKLTKLINKAGYPKNPKLTELYEFLFEKKFIQKHDALDDVKACLECYIKMKKD